MIKQLESVDPRNLTHQEKLAFWINIHNALVMHVRGLLSFDLYLCLCCTYTWFSPFQTFLVNGIPQNNGKRFLLLSKVKYYQHTVLGLLQEDELEMADLHFELCLTFYSQLTT